MMNVGHERGEPAALHRLRARQRHGAVSAPVKGVDEGKSPIAAGVPPRSLSAASTASAPLLVKKTRFVRAPAQPRQPLGQPDLGRIIEIRAGHVDQQPGLPADGLHDSGMRMTDVGHGDPRRVVEETVAVHVLDHRPLGAANHQGIHPRIRRGHDPMVAREPGVAARTRQRSQNSRLITVQRSHSLVLPGDRARCGSRDPSCRRDVAPTATSLPAGKLGDVDRQIGRIDRLAQADTVLLGNTTSRSNDSGWWSGL